jgi:hypothetical protein
MILRLFCAKTSLTTDEHGKMLASAIALSSSFLRTQESIFILYGKATGFRVKPGMTA